MSIINEALKKTQSNFSSLQGKASSLGNFGSPGGNQPSSGRTLLVVIVLIVGGIIFYIALSPKPVKTTAVRRIAPPAPVQTVPTPQAPPAPAPEPTPELILYGIISSGDGSAALINSEILKEGDTILGKKILKIYDTKVELDDSGKVMTLKTRK